MRTSKDCIERIYRLQPKKEKKIALQKTNKITILFYNKHITKVSDYLQTG